MGLLSSNEKKRAAAAELQQKRESASVFPSYDQNGNEFFRTYEFTLTGTRHKHDGNYGEKYIKESIIGDDVQLVWDKDNPYDREGWAVKVLWNGHYLGWLPADSGMMRQPIVLRLERGETVLARIKDIRDVKIREKAGRLTRTARTFGRMCWPELRSSLSASMTCRERKPGKRNRLIRNSQKNRPRSSYLHPMTHRPANRSNRVRMTRKSAGRVCAIRLGSC